MQRINKELEDALKRIEDPDLKKQLQAEWEQYAEQNKSYERDYTPGLDVEAETPEEQMERYNKEIIDKIDALKAGKEKAYKLEREVADKEEVSFEQQEERFQDNAQSLKFTFDNREEMAEPKQELAPHSPKTDKAPANDQMYWGVGWEKMPEPMQEALNSLQDDATRDALQKEWSELAAMNKHYEQSAYPKQVESAADFNRTFKANITLETPPDQMRRFNGIIMDKIAEIKGEKVQNKEQVYERDTNQNTSKPTPEDKQLHELKLTFDNRDDGMDMTHDQMDNVEHREQEMDRDELELEF